MLRKFLLAIMNIFIAIITSGTMAYCICCDLFLDRDFIILKTITRIVLMLIICAYGVQIGRIIYVDKIDRKGGRHRGWGAHLSFLFFLSHRHIL